SSREYVRVVGLAFDAAVPRPVVLVAVETPFVVGVVVPPVVGDEIAQGEAVVRGHEVDRGDRSARSELLRRTGEKRRELAVRTCDAATEVAYYVAETVVSIRPASGERAQQVRVAARIPRLCEQFHRRQHGVVADRRDDARVDIDDMVVIARECGRE